MSGDSVDDTKACHAAIRMKQTIVHIPIKEGAAFWGRGQPRNLVVGCRSNKYWKSGMDTTTETVIYRVKQLLGGPLSLRNYNAQVGDDKSVEQAGWVRYA